MSAQQPTITDLMDVVTEALTLPLAAAGSGSDFTDRLLLLELRADAVRAATHRVAICGAGPDVIAQEIKTLRKQVQQLPVAYRTYQPLDAPDSPRKYVVRGVGIEMEIGGRR